MNPQRTLWGEWEPYCGIWPKWGLSLRGEVYELPTWALPTDAREFSCWPTAVATDGASSARHSTSTGNMHPGTSLTDATAQWRSPAAQEPGISPGRLTGGLGHRMYDAESGRLAQYGLTQQAAIWQRKDGQWPTARAEDSESTGAHRGVNDTLTSATAMWPTPEAASGGRQSGSFAQKSWTDKDGMPIHLSLAQVAQSLWPTPRVKEDGSTPEAAKARQEKSDALSTTGGPHHKPSGLTQAVGMWPTPDASTRDNANLRTPAPGRHIPDVAAGDRHGVSLHHAVEFWPTPQARDEKNPDQPESGNYKRKQDAGYTIDLGSFAPQWRTPNTRDHHAGGPRLEAQESGRRQLTTADQAIQWSASENTSAAGAEEALTPTKTSEDSYPLFPALGAETLAAEASPMTANTAAPEIPANQTDPETTGLWPTPQTTDANGARQIDPVTGRRSFTGPGSWGMLLNDAAEHWPTPRTSDQQSGRGSVGNAGTAFSRTSKTTGERFGANLSDVSEQWPTPSAWQQEESPETFNARKERLKEKGYNGNGMGVPLDQMAAQWPTPMERDDWMTNHPRRDGRQNQLPNIAASFRDSMDEWPTPNVPNGGRTMSAEDVASKGATTRGKRQVGLENASLFWNTPSCNDFKDDGEAVRKRYGTDEMMTTDQRLRNQVEFWPTPMMDSPNSARGSGQDPEKRKAAGHTVGLNDMASFWPTTQARDWKSEEGDRESALNRMPRHAPSLSAMVQHCWPTPGADEGGGGKSLDPESGGPSFATVTTQWGTPRVGMERLDDVTYDRGRHNIEEQAGVFRCSRPDPALRFGLTFSERVRILLQLCRQLKLRLPSPYRKGRSIFRRKLNPDFTDWLMGLPPGYTSAGFDSSAMETWLCRSRRQCALLSSPGGSAYDEMPQRPPRAG